MCICVRVLIFTFVEVRGQLVGVGFLLPLYGLQGLTPGFQVWGRSFYPLGYLICRVLFLLDSEEHWNSLG